MTNTLDKLKNISKIEFINYLIMAYAFSLAFSGQIIRVFAVLLILTLIFDKNKPNIKYDKKIKYLGLSFIIFIVFCLLSFLWSDATIKDGFDYIRKFWYLIPIITIYIYLKENFYDKVILSFIIGIIVSSSLSLGNYFDLWSIAGGNVTNPAVFSYHTHYSVILAITVIILMFKFFYEKDIKFRIFYFISFSFVIMNLFINIGRTGQFSLLITIICLIFFYYRKKIKLLFLFISMIILFTLSNYFFNKTFQDRINSAKSDLSEAYYKKNYDSSLGGRFGFYFITKEILLENSRNLFLGLGSKQHINSIEKIIDDKYPYLTYTKTLKSYHSVYLDILSQFGIIGLLLFLSIIYKLLTITLKDRKISFIYISSIFIYCLSILVDQPIYKDIPLSVLALIIGTTFAMRKKQV